MSHKSEIGRIGEDMASEFLIRNKFKILRRNYWKPWGEIDIIAKDPDGTLVFVEVKSVRCFTPNSVLQPEDNLTRAKLEKVRRTAGLFAGSKSELINAAKGCRIDLVTVIVETGEIKHYENIG